MTHYNDLPNHQMVDDEEIMGHDDDDERILTMMKIENGDGNYAMTILMRMEFEII